MPNQRKPGKRQVAVWLNEGEYAALKSLAAARKSTMADVLKSPLRPAQKTTLPPASRG